MRYASRTMSPLPIRLAPGQDVRKALEAALASRGCQAAFVVAGIGSLSEVRVRFAGREHPRHTVADLEILTLSGTMGAHGSHLHASVAGPDGEVFGGHLAYGCIVRTTAEVLVALLDEWSFSREPDSATGHDELMIRPLARE
jgi:predicted DNA-binding protein with PD1-like motif